MLNAGRMTIRLAGLAALAGAVCGCAGMIREGRKTENVGIEIRGKLDTVVRALENTVRNEGYEVVTRPNAKGPGADGSEISCFRIRGVTRDQYRVMKLNGRFRNSIKYHGAIQAEMDEMAVRLTTAELKFKNYDRLKKYREEHGLVSDSVTGTSDRLVIDASRKWDPASDYQGEAPGIVVLKLDLLSCSLHFEELFEDCQQDVNGGPAIEEVLVKTAELLRSQPYLDGDSAGVSPPAGQPAGPAVVPSVDDIYRNALEFYNAGDYAGGWGKASEVVRLKPDHWEGWQLLGNCQYAKGDKTLAVSSYEYSLSIHPENPELKAWVGKIKGQ